jgi:uncharacterized protein YeaO (DUF488 family)
MTTRSLRLARKRAYSLPDPSDGFRVLVDRLWPRGLRKEDARIDLWLKEVAPSPALRRWFGHDPARWREFRRRYFRELDANAAVVEELRDRARKRTVTLVYAAKDEEHSHALALEEYLRGRADG